MHLGTGQQIKVVYLRMASREFGMPVDCKRWPPSNHGVIKRLLRKGLMMKVRKDTGSNKRQSFVFPTDKGLAYLEKHG
jgi:hypothetical protein